MNCFLYSRTTSQPAEQIGFKFFQEEHFINLNWITLISDLYKTFWTWVKMQKLVLKKPFFVESKIICTEPKLNM
jgi:hypothetical protein